MINSESTMSNEPSGSMISLALLREAAFELLASSAIGRYMREARRLTAESGLPAELQGNATLRARAEVRVAHLLEEIDRESLRIPAEFEAAILLCALVPTDPNGTRKLVRRASESSSAWIRALAAHVSSPGATSAALSRAA